MSRGMTTAVAAACAMTAVLGGCGVTCASPARLNTMAVIVPGLPATGAVAGTICIDGQCSPAVRSGDDSVITWDAPGEEKDVRVDVHLTAPVRVDATGLSATMERTGGGFMSCESVHYRGETTAVATP